MSKDLNLPMSSVMRQLTLNINVTGIQSNKLRVWLGLKILYLAALVMGTGFEVER